MTATAELGALSADSAYTPASGPSDSENAIPPVDRSGSSYLIISYGQGENAVVARRWLAEAAPLAPVQWLTFRELDAETRRQLTRSLRASSNGIRVMVVGACYDVMQTIALARSCGAIEEELCSLITGARDIPIYCAHCRTTSRVQNEPGELALCPCCSRTLEIHLHMSTSRGSYLASDARARDLP